MDVRIYERLQDAISKQAYEMHKCLRLLGANLERRDRFRNARLKVWRPLIIDNDESRSFESQRTDPSATSRLSGLPDRD